MNVYSLLKLVFLISALCSCGQMGPLYLPGTPPPIRVEKEKTAPPADEQKTDTTDSSSSSTSSQNQ